MATLAENAMKKYHKHILKAVDFGPNDFRIVLIDEGGQWKSCGGVVMCFELDEFGRLTYSRPCNINDGLDVARDDYGRIIERREKPLTTG